MGVTKELSRRNFMQAAIWGIGGLIGIGFGVPAVAYVVGPSLKSQQTQTWMRLGLVSKVEIGQPTLFKFKIKVQTGWIEDEQEASVYVFTSNGRDFVALSNICTHLGCRVRWIVEDEIFFCPCHNGVFNKEGEVVSGPPPRPLDRFEVKVQDDQLFIKGG
jgi:Rieske Fe-S protein